MTSDDTSVPGADSGAGRATSPASSPDVLRLVQTFDERFAPHLERASLAVRDAELALEKAHEALVQAEQAAASKPYVSDPLVFMRASLDDEVDGLRRKTTPKKVQAAYRYMLARAVELAAAEVQGYHDDQAALDHERQHGVEACRAAHRSAAERVAAARDMYQRVLAAEQTARAGLTAMVEKGLSVE